MSKRYKQDGPLIQGRFLGATFIVFLTVSLLTVRLWYIQVYNGQKYQKISENNRIRRIEIPPARGNVFDRNGKIALGNRQFFDLVYMPQYVVDKEQTLKALSNLLHVPINTFEHMLKISKGRPKFLPVTLKRNLTIHEVSVVESNKIFLPGIDINVAPRRNYKPYSPPHIVGYLGEIDSKTLKKYNKLNPDNRYLPGDLVGKQGLEYRWEKYLHGKRGYRFIQVDAFGRKSSSHEDGIDWKFPVQQSVPGADLTLTLDLKLQEAALKAFQGKYGAVVVLDPRNGDILAMVSSPDYDPPMYQNSLSNEKWRSLITDPYKPLFDKTAGGEFMPGSVYKPVVAMAALEEKLINPQKKIFCGGSFELGNDLFHCHSRSGHGWVDLRTALMKSCDVYFYTVGVELGVDKIAKYARAFGLGKKLGVRLNLERPGLIPTFAWKKKATGRPWQLGDTPNIAIGQGSVTLTPIQMATLYASIANGGKLWRPQLLKKVNNHIGETLLEHKPDLLKNVEIISPKTFKLMRNILEDVVMHPKGTGKRARVDGVTVAGKTGSVQVVSLKKNHNQQDVSMRWREHAMFAAFSPAKNAEIAIAVVSENDRVGGGGLSAAPVAQAIIEKYWQLKDERQNALKSATKDIENNAKPQQDHAL